MMRNVINKLIDIFGSYKVLSNKEALYIGKMGTRPINVILCKKLFGFKKIIKTRNNLFFQIFDKKTEIRINYGIIEVEKDRVKLGYKKRNKIKKVLEKHFDNYLIGNYKTKL